CWTHSGRSADTILPGRGRPAGPPGWGHPPSFVIAAHTPEKGMDDTAGHFHRFPVRVPNQVRWGEMDAFQHVNNVVFFNYFENARIDYLTRVGFADREALGGIGPILHSTHAR